MSAENVDEIRTLIFYSVVSRLLESVAPYVSFVLSEFEKENKISHDGESTYSSEYLDEKLDELFQRFPRKIPLYKEIIIQMTAMAGSNVTETIHFLTKTIKDILHNTVPSTPFFQSIQGFWPFFDPYVRHQALFLYYFGLFFFSDLTCQIVATYSYKDFTNFDEDEHLQNSSHSYYKKEMNNLENAVNFLTKTGHKLAISEKKLPKTSFVIIKQWSVIFSILSERNFAEVSQHFQLFSSLEDISYPICLMRYIRLDLSDSFSLGLFEDILNLFKSHAKKKTLTNSALESLTCMISTLSYKEDLYQKIYTFARSVKKEKNLAEGSTLLSSAVIQYLPNKFNRLNYFLQKRILAHVANKEQLPTLLKCFELFIIGKNREPSTEIWEWGPKTKTFKKNSYYCDHSYQYSAFDPSISKIYLNSPSTNSSTSNFNSMSSAVSNSNINSQQQPLTNSSSRDVLSNSKETIKYEYIILNSAPDVSQDDPKSFTSLFMNNFYAKSDFSVCPQLFKKILIHLASLNFQVFIDTFVRKTLELSYDDPRFITLLMLVPLINSENFKSNAFKTVTDEMVTDFDQLIKPYVIEATMKCKSEIQSKSSKHGICIKEYDIFMDSLINEADQKLDQTLAEWKVSEFKPTIVKHNRSVTSQGAFDLPGKLIHALQFVIDDEQLSDPKFIQMLIEFASSTNDNVSSTAFSICNEIVPKYISKSEYLKVLMNSISFDKDVESVFVILLLIYSSLRSIHSPSKKPENPKSPAPVIPVTNSPLSSKELNSVASVSTVYNEMTDNNKEEILNKNHEPTPIDEDFLHDLESIVFICHSSMFPMTRHLVFIILRKINQLLHNHGIISYCQKRTSIIEKKAKMKILLNKIPKKLEPISSPPIKIALETVILSHYYEIWLFFLSEIMNTLIEVNYTPLFKRIDKIRPMALQLIEDTEKPFWNRNKNLTGILIIILDPLFYKKYLLRIMSLASSNMSNKKDSGLNVSQKDKENRRRYLNEANQDFSDNSEEDEEEESEGNYNRIDTNDGNSNIPLTTYLSNILVSSNLLSFSLADQFEPFNKENEDKRGYVCQIMNNLLCSNDENLSKIGFSVIPHLHFSLLAPLIDVLAKVPSERLVDATQTLSIVFRLPEIDKNFFIHNFMRITRFLNTLHDTFLKKSINGLYTIDWNSKMQEVLDKFSPHLLNYCIIIMFTFSAYKDGITDAEWPMTTRAIVFRFLINWAITTSSNLKSLRGYAELALATLARVGPFFTDPRFIDDRAIDLFGSMELNGVLILKNLIVNQYDVFLKIFIKACYTQPNSIADLYFDAIVDTITSTKPEYASNEVNSDDSFSNRPGLPVPNKNKYHIEIITHYIGDLILLSQVFYQKENARSTDLILNYLTISNLNLNTNEIKTKASDPKMIPSIFPFATEAVFHAFFKLMRKLKGKIRVPYKCIVEAVRPWTKMIRLLPMQLNCSASILPQFHYYTPYTFVKTLIDATDPSNDDLFRLMTTLWIDLAQSPDNINVIPLFISSPHSLSEVVDDSIAKMFTALLNTYPRRCMEEIVSKCSFAYYYYTTKCLNESFTVREKWLSQMLVHSVHRSWKVLSNFVPVILHFAFIFRSSSTTFLFEVLCRKMNVEFTEGCLDLSTNTFIEQVNQFISRMSDEEVLEWGNEALKWFLGSEDVEIAVTSLQIYNQIKKPFDPSLVLSVIKTVSYHIEHSKDKLKLLIRLTKDSFQIFNIYEAYYRALLNDSNSNLSSSDKDKKGFNDLDSAHIAFNYTFSFLDCRVFVESDFTKDALKIVHRAMKYPDLIQVILNNTISFLRPMLLIIEVNSNAQKIIDMAFSKTKKEELFMIIAPVKKTFPQLFPSCPPFEKLISKVSENGKSAALVHYSMMATTASRSVLNNIFEISDLIVNSIKLTVNNNIPLAKLYQAALRAINKCHSAIDFVRSICEKDPTVAAVNIVDVYEWDRPIDYVNRSIKLLIKQIEEGSEKEMSTGSTVSRSTSADKSTSPSKELKALKTTYHSPKSASISNIAAAAAEAERNHSKEKVGEMDHSASMVFSKGRGSDMTSFSSFSSPQSIVTITDFHSYIAAQNILYADTPPKVIPFSTQADIIEGMKKLPPPKKPSLKIKLKAKSKLKNGSPIGSRVKPHTQKKITTPLLASKKRSSSASLSPTKSSPNIYQSSSGKFTIPESVSITFNEQQNNTSTIGPLIHPKELILEPATLLVFNDVKEEESLSFE